MFNSSNKILRLIITILSIVGILLTIDLAVIYFKANFIANADPSFCAINAVIDCDAVAQSSDSVFLGIPLALYGFSFYCLVLFLNIFPYYKKINFFKEFNHPNSYIFSLATISVFVSILLAYISAHILNKICILCYVTYFVNLLIFLASFLRGRKPIDMYKHSIFDTLSFVQKPAKLVFSIIIILLIASTLAFTSISGIFIAEKETPIDIDKIIKENYKFKHHSGNGNILGAKNPILIVHEYTDYECPFCSLSNQQMFKLAEDIKGIQIQHHDFPLNSECNSEVKGKPHKYACSVAKYARAAKKQNKYWPFLKKLFENQNDLSEENIFKIATNIGIDIDKLKKDANNPQINKQLLNDVEKANKLGIKGTPSYIINEKKYVGLMYYNQLKEIVEKHIKEVIKK